MERGADLQRPKNSAECGFQNSGVGKVPGIQGKGAVRRIPAELGGPLPDSSGTRRLVQDGSSEKLVGVASENNQAEKYPAIWLIRLALM